MKLTVRGNINEYYVQTLCLLFFPGSRFSKSEAEPEGSPCADVCVTEDENTVTATVSLSFGGKSAEKTATESISTSSPISDAHRIAVGKAFFAAGKSIFGISPQWGILTGVRPSKIALRQLFDGKTKAEVRSCLSKELFVSPKKAALVTDIAATEKKIISKVPKNSCSVYISIPFCPTRCSYCSFVSVSSKKLLSMLDDYLDRLIFDLDRTFETIRSLGLTVSTVYVGGGTPTTLDEDQLKKLTAAVMKNVDVSALEEYTVEAGRPDTVTAEKLKILKESGVTRVSVNTQTLNDDVLEAIGRRHTSKQFLEAFELAKKSGIKHINTDLIAGLPGEGFRSFSETIDRMIELRPDNLTFHTLCIKSAADFAQHMRGMDPAGSGDASKSVDYAQASAKNAGYIPYYIYRQKNTVENLENVGFALPGAEGRYNIYMMEEIHSIFAVGAGAVSKLVSDDKNLIERIFEFKYPYEYLAEDKTASNDEKARKIIGFYETKHKNKEAQ